MAGPVEQVGELGACPRCGAEVLLKTTIPILGPNGEGVEHVCRVCSRSLVVVGGEAREPRPEPAPTDLPAEPVA